MTITRKQRSPEFKAKVALEALKESKTVNEIAGTYQVHTGQVTQWKTRAERRRGSNLQPRQTGQRAKGTSGGKRPYTNKLGG